MGIERAVRAGQTRLIACITEGAQIRRILDHIGVDSEPPHIAPARGPSLGEERDARVKQRVFTFIDG
jgi:hypothetical protein